MVVPWGRSRIRVRPLGYRAPSYRARGCRALSYHAFICRALSCHALGYHALSYHALSYHALSYPALSYRVMGALSPQIPITSCTIPMASYPCLSSSKHLALPYLWPGAPVFQIVSTMRFVWARLGLI